MEREDPKSWTWFQNLKWIMCILQWYAISFLTPPRNKKQWPQRKKSKYQENNLEMMIILQTNKPKRTNEQNKWNKYLTLRWHEWNGPWITKTPESTDSDKTWTTECPQLETYRNKNERWMDQKALDSKIQNMIIVDHNNNAN